jgi:hypothetical protein
MPSNNSAASSTTSWMAGLEEIFGRPDNPPDPDEDPNDESISQADLSAAFRELVPARTPEEDARLDELLEEVPELPEPPDSKILEELKEAFDQMFADACRIAMKNKLRRRGWSEAQLKSMQPYLDRFIGEMKMGQM